MTVMGKVFKVPSASFNDWLNGMPFEEGFSRVLKEKADKWTNLQPHTVLNAEDVVSQFIQLPSTTIYTIFNFRSITYFFAGDPNTVEPLVRSFPLGRLKLPGRKKLVNTIFKCVSTIRKELARYHASDMKMLEDLTEALPKLGASPSDLAKKERVAERISGLREKKLREFPNARALRDWLKEEGPGQILLQKEVRTIQKYVARDDVHDDVLEEALAMCVAQDVLEF